MDEPRIIKKYPNRRLYDTAKSSYITLGDVRQLVLDEVSFRVVDARSKQDLTRSILLQIILEQEEDGEPIFSSRVLEQIIRFYGGSFQGMISTYLERSMDLFVAQQDRVGRQVQNLLGGGDALNVVQEVTEQNLRLWREMQEDFFKAAMGTGTRGARADEDKKR